METGMILLKGKASRRGAMDGDAGLSSWETGDGKSDGKSAKADLQELSCSEDTIWCNEDMM